MVQINAIKNDWDIYWSSKLNSSNVIYDILAKIYRQVILKPFLRYFVKQNIIQDARVLHAGCGSGQVDKDLSNYIKITPLDISPQALSIYKKENPHSSPILGDIFVLPFPQKSFDAIYNLGVMEHYTESEIRQILEEFSRVLKPNGTVILFWPPQFGLSVWFLDNMHRFLHLFNKDIKLHPEEITRIQSKSHAQVLIETNGFRLTEYYFGIRDLFCQTVLICKKCK